MGLRSIAAASVSFCVLAGAPEQTGVLRAQEGGPAIVASSTPGAAIYNLRVVTDASPDLTDLDSFIKSTTSQWTTPEEKVWALFYWSHILKRQTSPIVLHGFEVTDPVRNFNDYGFTMCSTISGINQTLYEALGLQHQYWDICNHTVAQVYYNNAFHMIDSSMSNLVTRDDGTTLASLQEAAADGARLVKERSLYSTSPYGFLTGSDTMRALPDAVNPVDGSVMNGFARAFCETGLKFRDYYYNWNSGHRYVLNLREHESFTRYYRRLGEGPDYYVGSEHESNSDPTNTFENDSANKFGLRGNGRWLFAPPLDPAGWQLSAYSWRNIGAVTGGGLSPITPEEPGEVIYKVQAANAITSQHINAQFARTGISAVATLSLSVNHGATWQDIGSIGTDTGATVPLTVNLRNEVSGQYETLLRITMSQGSAEAITLMSLSIETITQVNAKALPRLNIGRNEVYVGARDQSDTMVLWPDLRGDLWKRDAYDSSNIGSQSVAVSRKYTAVVYPAILTQDAYLTYRMQSPTDFTRVRYGGRLYNYRTGSYIDFLHSFDNGVTWTRSYRLSDVNKPYDVVHYETVDVPPGVRTVLFKFLLHNTSPETYRATGLYSVRIEGDYRRTVDSTPPLDVTLRWTEIRADRTTVARSHKQRVDQFPFKYIVNVGGSDHPTMDSMTLNVATESDSSPYGYSDGVDAGGQKYGYTRRVDGTNLASGKPYTISRAPSQFQSSAGAENTSILTDGVVGAPLTGSYSYWWGQCWTSGSTVDLVVDLGATADAGAVRAHLFGYPSWDAFKGDVADRVEVLTSNDGVSYTTRGFLNTSLWRKDLPINYMLQDTEKATGWNFELGLPAQVTARFVKYHVTPKRNLCISELQVLDGVTYQSFDLHVTLPADESSNQPPTVSVTSPQQGQVFTSGAAVSMAANAADADGSIANVEFLVNGSVVATDGFAPYEASWTSTTAGSYSVTARAVDNVGSAVVSSPVTITVQETNEAGADVVLWAAEAPIRSGWIPTPDTTAASGNRLQNPNLGGAKVVTALASPTQYFEMTFRAIAGRPYRLWMRGKALSNSYANDSVHVQFDGSLDENGAAAYRIGTTSSLTYNLEECNGCGESGWGWEDTGWGSRGLLGPVVYFQASGLQRIRVQVREDGLGIDQIVLSSNHWLTLSPGLAKDDTVILLKTDDQDTNAAPSVSIVEPHEGTALAAPAAVTIAADASDSDGTVTRVDFYANGTLIATDPEAPWSIVWDANSAGAYALTARAIDDLGAGTTSAAVNVTITSSASGNDVVLYAADSPLVVNWSLVADSTAAGGLRLQNPNLRAAKVQTASATPAAYFELTFNALQGRPYRLWIRGKALSNSYDNDSVHVQFDSSVDTAGAPTYRIGTTSSTVYNLEECSGCGLSGWGWEDNGWGARSLLGPAIYFDHDGLQTIRVQVREDGLGIDQIVLSSATWLDKPPGPAKNDTTILPKQ